MDLLRERKKPPEGQKDGEPGNSNPLDKAKLRAELMWMYLYHGIPPV